MQTSRYVDIVRHFTGAKVGYNPWLLGTTIVIVLSIVSIYMLTVFCYFRKFGNEQLTPKHTLICLGLWILAKLIMIPSNSNDMVWHQVWKTIGVHHSMNEFYESRCFALDYPPLMAFFEKAWGHILY